MEWRGVPERSEPRKHRAEPRAHRGAAVIGAMDEMVFVREIEIPRHPMQEFSSIMGVKEIRVASLEINGEAGLAKLR